MKIARAATGRFKTISFWDAFHGAGFGAGALSGEALFRSGPAAPLVAGRDACGALCLLSLPLRHQTDARKRSRCSSPAPVWWTMC